MRLNHQDIVVALDGSPVIDPDGQPTTFRGMVIPAIGIPEPDMGAEMKARLFALSTKFFKGKFVNLTVDEAALIKERCGKYLPPLGYGRVCEWLEEQPPAVATDDEPDEA